MPASELIIKAIGDQRDTAMIIIKTIAINAFISNINAISDDILIAWECDTIIIIKIILIIIKTSYQRYQ